MRAEALDGAPLAGLRYQGPKEMRREAAHESRGRTGFMAHIDVLGHTHHWLAR